MIMAGIARTVINDVQAHRWMSTTRGKTHAYLAPTGDLAPGKVRALCPVTTDAARLTDSDDVQGRCKTCAKLSAPDTRKRGTGLSEPQLPVVNKGATAAPTIGARDGSVHMDGPALVQGPNMRAERRTWTNPVTHEVEPAAARLDGSLRDRPDRDPNIPPVRPRRTRAAQRRFRQRATAVRNSLARQGA